MTYESQPASFGRRGVQAPAAVERAPRVERINVDEMNISAGMVFAYIGHNAHNYEGVVSALEAKQDSFHGMAPSWNWGAFFFPVLWLIYRKRFAGAAGMFFLTMIMGFMFPKQSVALLPFQFVFATMAKGLYVNSAASHIKRIVARQTNAADASIAIRAAGGVSPGAVWASLGLLFVIFMLIIVQAVMTYHGPR